MPRSHPVRWTRFAIIALVVGSATTLSAKARILWKRVDNLEAVVVRVETGDEPGDADWDIYLRPATPEAAVAFWAHFWAAGNRDWIDDDLAPAFQAARGHLSSECKQCAGPGPEGAACNIEAGHVYDQNPCPRFFACAPCLLDLERMPALGSDSLAKSIVNVMLQDVTVKAELFFGQSKSEAPPSFGSRSAADGKWYDPDNDLNARLTSTMFDLGFRDRNGQHFNDEGTVCNELAWRDGKYRDVSGRSICGKHIFISGRATLDQSHSKRPEVHPVSAIVVDDGAVGNHTRQFRVGTFIDGSQDTRGLIDNWSFDYHEWGKKLLPAQVKLPFARLQGDAPKGHCVSPGGHGTTCENWIPVCSVDHLRAFHATTQAVAVADRCADEQVDMDWTQVNGAASVSRVRLGWDEQKFFFQLTAKRAEPLGGILADHVPRASGQTGECKLPTGKYERSQLRRWYRYKVTTHALFGGIPQKDIQWTWQRPLPGAVFDPELPAKVPEGDRALDLWLPVPDKDKSHYFYPDFEVDYGGKLKGAATVSGAPSVWAADEVEAPQPSVAIATRHATANPDGSFHIEVVARPEGFCGDAGKLHYDWDIALSTAPARKNGVFHVEPVATAVAGKVKLPFAAAGNAGPIPVELQPGQLARISVTVEDPYGVERSVHEILLTAPELQIETRTACLDKDGGEKHTGSLPPGWVVQGTPQFWNENWCRSTAITAHSFAIPHGVDKVFPESTVAAPSYAWSDVKVSLDRGATWQAPPASWKLLHPEQPDKQLVFQPDRALVFQYQAAVTVTDKYGRSATAHVVGSNDFTPLPDLRDRLARAWTVWRPGVPVPDPAREDAGDPMVSELALLQQNLQLIKPGDTLGESMVRAAVQSFVSYGFAKVGRERGVTTARTSRAVFTRPETAAEEDRLDEAREDAHADARRRLGATATGR